MVKEDAKTKAEVEAKTREAAKQGVSQGKDEEQKILEPAFDAEEEAEIQRQVDEQLRTKRVELEVQRRLMTEALSTGSGSDIDTDNPYGIDTNKGEEVMYIEDGFIKNADGEVLGNAPQGQPKTKITRPLVTLDAAKKLVEM